MVIRELRNFDLRQIARSGQCFRMTEVSAEEIQMAGLPFGGGAYRVISGSRCLTAARCGGTVAFSCGEEEFPYWENYFDLPADYGEFIASVDEDDHFLQKAAAFGSGIRILRQDPWEMIVTFILSQQKTVPAIRVLVERLSERYGSPVTAGDFSFYAFPTYRQLSRATLDELLELKLGYRAKYVFQICRDACSGALDPEKLKTLSYPEAMAYLQRFYGIGKKVADCVCLFGLHHIEAFPVDTRIRQVLMREYAIRCDKAELDKVPKSGQCDFLAEKFFLTKYEGYAGVMQQYLFYYEPYAMSR